MLSLKECDDKIDLYQKTIRYIESLENQWVDGYIEHLRYLIKAYEVERLKRLQGMYDVRDYD